MTETLRPRESRFVGLTDGARLPLAFIAMGMVYFAAAAAWSFLQPSLWSMPFLHPRVVAFVHLWLPGFLVSACAGAIYQLMPVVLGASIPNRVSTLWLHFSMHLSGMILLVTGLLGGSLRLLVMGGLLVTTGIVVLVATVWQTFLKSSRRDAVGCCFPFAASWLLLTVLGGVTLAIQRHAPWLPLPVLGILKAHAHLGLIGFFVTLLQGATFHLIPMFTLGTIRWSGAMNTGFFMSQLALPALATGLALGQGTTTHLAATAMVLANSLTYAAFLRTLQTRRRQVLDPGMCAFATGMTLLQAAGMVGLVLLFIGVPDDSIISLVARYGLFFIPGALALTVMGMLCKIVPFLVWMRAYGPLLGRVKVPVATELSSQKLEAWWLRLHLTALALLFLGTFFPSGPLERIGPAAFAAGAVCYFANLIRIGRHLKPRLLNS